MAYEITNSDIELCNTRLKELYIDLTLLNADLTTNDTMDGQVVSGDETIDSTSDIRRTLNFVLYSEDSSYDVAEYNRIWLNRRVRCRLAFKTPLGNYMWYEMGIFNFDSCSYEYGTETKSISVQCSDLITQINGTHGGTLSGASFLIEADYDIKKAIEDIIDNHTDITSYDVSTIGVYGCLQGKSVNWKSNRMDYGSTQAVVNLEESDGVDYLTDNPNMPSGATRADYVDLGTWHTVPYDLEFSAGLTVYEVIQTLKDLYCGYEAYFDIDGTFIVDCIPTCENDPIVLDYFDITPLVISESINIDLTTVRNATQIYGQSIEVDRYSDESTTSITSYNSAYAWVLNLSSFALSNGLKVGFQVPSSFSQSSYTSTRATYIRVTSSSTTYNIPCCERSTIINSDGENEIVYNTIPLSFYDAGESYCFKYVSNQDCFVYLGKYQIEAYDEDDNDDSPFAVSKIGTRLQVLTGGDYDNITDLAAAKERAEYETWLSTRLNDTLTLETVLIPFLDVNQKVRYRTYSNGQIETYIVKSISHSFLEGRSTITLSKFYDLYPNIVCS